jgi:hypothetical protein
MDEDIRKKILTILDTSLSENKGEVSPQLLRRRSIDLRQCSVFLSAAKNTWLQLSIVPVKREAMEPAFTKTPFESLPGNRSLVQ